MKNYILIFLFYIFSLNSIGQINQISIGIGRADQWGQSLLTNVGDSAIGFNNQTSMDSRMTYSITLDYKFKKFNIYQNVTFSVMYIELKLLTPGRTILYLENTLVNKTPTIDYSVNVPLLKPAKRLTLWGGGNIRFQWPKNISDRDWANEFVINSTNAIVPVTLGINLNLRYQTRWLRIEFGYIGDVTSTSRDFVHNGQIISMAPVKMQKIYLMLSGPVFRKEKPPKKLKKKDFIRN